MVTSGFDKNGKPLSFYIDQNLKDALDIAKKRVEKRNWDYASVVSGIPGSGKSAFARTVAKYCDPTFDESRIAFKVEGKDGGFIDITNRVPNNSAVILDESFESLNSRVSMSPDFLRIINHLQIIRQKNLFILLCLPNFFDLSKSIAVFRASHLFVVYASSSGERGKFLAFGRDSKRKLYVKGGKYMDYSAEPANFIGRFTRNDHICDITKYDQMKFEHLQSKQKEIKVKKDPNIKRDIAIWKMKNEKEMRATEISEIYDINVATVHRSVNLVQDTLEREKIDIKTLQRRSK